ncbi:MAG: hypothetical protein WC910_09515 [Bacteroidales bacterium]|jgi:hypothetical protein
MGMKEAEALKIGADPEAQFRKITGPDLTKDYTIISADSLIQSGSSSGWGLDGCRHTAELRTKGGCKDAFAMVKELEGYMHDLATRIPEDHCVTAGSNTGKKFSGGGSANYIPTGGHIHFGMDEQNRQQAGYFADVLDYMLMVPFMFIEDPVRAKRRRVESSDRRYGALHNAVDLGMFSGDAIRQQSWGLEYRSPASWLVSKAFTTQILALSHTIMYDLLLEKELPQFSKIYRGRVLRKQACEAHLNGDRAFFKGELKKIFSVLQNAELYKSGKYTKEITSLFGLALAWMRDGKNWREDQCILQSWGVERDYDFFLTLDAHDHKLTGDMSDPVIKKLVGLFADKTFSRPIHLYKLGNDSGLNFMLYGDYKTTDLDMSYISEQKPVLPEVKKVTNFVGIADMVRADASFTWIKDTVGKFISKMEK